MLVWHFVLFGLSFAELQLFTLQLYSTLTWDTLFYFSILYCPSWQSNLHFCLLTSGFLVVSWRELNFGLLVMVGVNWTVAKWTGLRTGLNLNCLWPPFYNLAANWIVNTLLSSSSLRGRGIMLTELLHSNWLSLLCWLQQIWLLWDRCLGMAIPLFFRCRGYGRYRSVA
jgi:hypothetical protein